MNFITAHIYSRRHPVTSLLASSVQLAIIQQVEQLVNDHGSSSTQLPAWTTSSGRIVLGHATTQLLESTNSYLLETIFHWNDKSNVDELALDVDTVRLANEIEAIHRGNATCRTAIQAKIATLIRTDCDKSVAVCKQLAENTTTLLVDPVTGLPSHITTSLLGARIHNDIIRASQLNTSGSPIIHIIQAPQGTGKTRFLSTVVAQLASDNSRVVCVSPRQPLVSAMYHTFSQVSSIGPDNILVGASPSAKIVPADYEQRPVDEYSVTVTTINSMSRIWKRVDELNRQHDRLEYKLSHNLISDDEYDSEKAKLRRIRSNSDPYVLVPKHDVLVYDEFQLLRTTIVSGTHIETDEAFDIRQRLHQMECEARAILVMDADIDKDVIEYFVENHPDCIIHMHRFIVPEEREIYLHEDNSSLLNWLYDQVKEIEPKAPGIVAPASFAVACTSVVTGRKIEQAINYLRPDLKVIWIEAGNSHRPPQRALITDPSLAVQYDIIIYSPKLFTGFSFDPIDVDGQVIPVANRVVGVFGGRKINWIDRSQSLFRIRGCQEFHFSVESSQEDNEDALPTIDWVKDERVLVFERGGLTTPVPVAECDNDNMVLYFRSRGFSVVYYR